MMFTAFLALSIPVFAAAASSGDSAIFPDWGRVPGVWKDQIPGKGWMEAGLAIPAGADTGEFVDGFRSAEKKYFRIRGGDSRKRAGTGFSLTAAPGQYASFSFRVEAERGWQGLRAGISPLKDGRGAAIGPKNQDIRLVRPLVKRIYQTRTYAGTPTLLDKFDSLDLVPRRPITLWVTIFVSSGQEPGIYSGKVFLREGTAQVWSSPVSLTVLPFRLKDPDRIYQLYYSLSRLDPVVPETVPREMRDIRAHGINSLAFLATPELSQKSGEPAVDFTRSIAGEALGLDSLISCYKAAGFSLPINYSFCLNQLWHHPEGGWRRVAKDNREFRRGLRALFKEASSQVRDGSWPVLHFGLDEPSPRLDEAARLLEWVREDYPYPSLVNCHGSVHGVDDIARLSPLAGIVSVIRTVPGLSQSMARIRSEGRKFWICNGGGFGTNPLADRYFFGLDAWGLRADGVSQWNYHQGNDEFWTPEKPYGKYRGDYPTFAYGYPSPTGPIPSLAWEAVREGIDDARFLATLEGLLEVGGDYPVSPGRNAPAADRARKYLDSLKKSLPVENMARLRYLAGKEEDFLDDIRNKVTELILSLPGEGREMVRPGPLPRRVK